MPEFELKDKLKTEVKEFIPGHVLSLVKSRGYNSSDNCPAQHIRRASDKQFYLFIYHLASLNSKFIHFLFLFVHYIILPRASDIMFFHAAA